MTLTFDPAQCRAALDLFELLLAQNPDLSEREQILPFFRMHRRLSLLLGAYSPPKPDAGASQRRPLFRKRS